MLLCILFLEEKVIIMRWYRKSSVFYDGVLKFSVKFLMYAVCVRTGAIWSEP